VPSWRRANSPTSHSRRTASCTSRGLHGPATASVTAAMVTPTGPAASNAVRMCSRIVTGVVTHRLVSSVNVTSRRPPAIGAVHC